MIKRPLRSNFSVDRKIVRQKIQQSNQLKQPISKIYKSLFPQNRQNASLILNSYQLVKRREGLKQISINSNINSKILDRISTNKKCKLFSQNSVNDLSEIVQLESLYTNSKKASIQTNIFSNENSMIYDDIQILNVYINESAKKHSNTQEQKKLPETIKSLEQAKIIEKEKSTSQEVSIKKFKQRRGSGTIRRNSIKLENPFTNEQENLFGNKQKNLFTNKQENPFTKKQILNILACKQTNKILVHRQENNIFINKQQYQHKSKYNTKQIITKCAIQIFLFISCNKKAINFDDLRKVSFNSQVKVILGPLISKLNKQKTAQLDQRAFIREFQHIFKQFSNLQKQQIIKIVISEVNRLKQQAEISKYAKKQSFLSKKNIQNQNTTQTKLKILHSKVDLYLNKIQCKSENSIINENSTKKKKLSQLINELSIQRESQSMKYPTNKSLNPYLTKQHLIEPYEIIQQQQYLQQRSESISQLKENSSDSINICSISQSILSEENEKLSTKVQKLGLNFNQLSKYLNK